MLNVKKNNNVMLIIVLLVTVVFFCSSCGTGKSSTLDNTENSTCNSNLIIGGEVAIQDEICCYDNGNGLFVSKLDGSEKRQLAMGDISSINIKDEWVYYVEGKSIYKTLLDGSESIELSIYTTNLVLDGEWLYYSYFYDYSNNNYGLYKMKLDGSEKQILAYGIVKNINVSGDWVYYTLENSANDGLYKVKTDGSENTLIYNDEFIIEHGLDGNVILDGDWLYYYKQYVHVDNNKGIYKVKTDGSEWQPVILVDKEQETITDFSVYNNEIYYCLEISSDENDSIKYCVFNMNEDASNVCDGQAYNNSSNSEYFSANTYFCDDYVVVQQKVYDEEYDHSLAWP